MGTSNGKARAFADVMRHHTLEATGGQTYALNMAFMAENLAMFAIVVGFALTLAGIGFVVLALVVLHPRRQEATAPALAPAPAVA